MMDATRMLLSRAANTINLHKGRRVKDLVLIEIWSRVLQEHLTDGRMGRDKIGLHFESGNFTKLDTEISGSHREVPVLIMQLELVKTI